MQIDLTYNNREYFVLLEVFEEVKENVEIFKLTYDGKSEKYLIKLWVAEDDQWKMVKVTTMSEHFRETLGKEIKEMLDVTFVANPYFDEVMIIYGHQLTTSKDRYKPYQCAACTAPALFTRTDKENKTSYILEVQKLLSTNPNMQWPFKGRLHVQFSISDKQARLNSIDLDNVAKSLFDSLQGIVFDNDAQIATFVGDKECVKGIIAYIVAIKTLQPTERAELQNFIYSGNLATWNKERKAKAMLKKQTRFAMYQPQPLPLNDGNQ